MRANPNLSNYVSKIILLCNSLKAHVHVFATQNGDTPVMITRELDEKEILQELVDNHANSEVSSVFEDVIGWLFCVHTYTLVHMEHHGISVLYFMPYNRFSTAGRLFCF